MSISLGLALVGCATHTYKTEPMSATFEQDANFLLKHTDAVILQKGDARLAVVPEYQGRVMTASAEGQAGASSGWINYDLVAQGVVPDDEAEGLDRHMYAFGGEERFWMGPEGGQYSIFFAQGTDFEFENWFTPDAIDNEPWPIVNQSSDSIAFAYDFSLTNHSGTQFDVGVDRKVSLLGEEQLSQVTGLQIPDNVAYVAYETENTVTNLGDAAWEKSSGLLSIWLLCMFQPSPTTTVFIPYVQGDEVELGPVVNANYFGEVPPERLKVREDVIYFRADGKERGKIGVPPGRSRGYAASYDPVAERLTLLVYEQPSHYPGYVNSLWELQTEPYVGDAINSYNDGPVDGGEQMGPFYELESSSPALALQPGVSATHSQIIAHFYGKQADLQTIVAQFCNVSLETVKAQF